MYRRPLADARLRGLHRLPYGWVFWGRRFGIKLRRRLPIWSERSAGRYVKLPFGWYVSWTHVPA